MEIKLQTIKTNEYENEWAILSYTMLNNNNNNKNNNNNNNNNINKIYYKK